MNSGDRIFDVLASGEMEVLGLMPYASNATFLAKITSGEDAMLAVYKPRRGERPLWDFPSGTLCLREYAAWVLDALLGWDLVPPTVLRDGPAGMGAVQAFIEEDELFDVQEVANTHPDELRKISLFDVLANNADRKAGHILADTNGKLWAIDHGVTFHDEPKLRTVIWVYEGEPVPRDLLEDVACLPPRIRESEVLHQLLSADEILALGRRIEGVLTSKRYPVPGPGGRHVPWPPW